MWHAAAINAINHPIYDKEKNNTMNFHITLFVAACLAATTLASYRIRRNPVGNSFGPMNSRLSERPIRPNGHTKRVWCGTTRHSYTRMTGGNVRVENGCLVIEARKEHVGIPGKPGSFTEYTPAASRHAESVTGAMAGLK